MPPIDMSAPKTVYTVFYVLFVLQLVPGLGWLVLRAVKGRSVTPVALAGGAAFVGYFAPPVLNHLTDVWFPSNIPLAYLTSFGMRDPSFDFMGYVLFFGVGGYYVYEAVPRRGAAVVWLMAIFAGVADLAYELPFLSKGMYRYYGPQRLTVDGFPLHWVALNAAVPVVTGVLVHALTGPAGSAARAAVLAPLVSTAGLLLAVLPVAVVLHSDDAAAVGLLASIVSGCFGVAAIVWAARRAEAARAVCSTGSAPVALVGDAAL